jgi:hypothetical protein
MKIKMIKIDKVIIDEKYMCLELYYERLLTKTTTYFDVKFID